jgi:ABC-type iron transport system FetAB permease component
MIRSKDDHEKITIKTNSGRILDVTLTTTERMNDLNSRVARVMKSLNANKSLHQSRIDAIIKGAEIAKKSAAGPTLEEIQKQGVVLGSSFDWMFEGEDKKYDELYGDYI